MARGNTLDLEILGRILIIRSAGAQQGRRLGMTHSCEFQNLGGKVFEDGCDIDGCLGSNAHLVLGVVLQKSLDTTAGELEMVSVSNAAERNARAKRRSKERNP